MSGLAQFAFFGIETSQQIKGYSRHSKPLGSINSRHPAGGWDGIPRLHCARMAFFNADGLGEVAVESFDYR